MVLLSFPSGGAGGGGAGATLSEAQRAVLAANRYTGRLDDCRAVQPGTTLAALSPYTRAGATLTSNALASFPAIDTGSVGVGGLFIVWNEPDPMVNGLYQLTAPGAAGVSAWTATRAADFAAGADVQGRIVAPYPFIGSANREWCFIVAPATEGPVIVGTDPVPMVRIERSRVMAARYDLSNSLTLITESGQRVQTESRDTFQISGGSLVVGADTSFSIPAAGRLLTQPRRLSMAFADNGSVELFKQEEYLDLDADTETVVDFQIPAGARLVGILLAWDGNGAGPATYNLGWTDDATAFVAAAPINANQNLILGGAVQRDPASPGTIQIQSTGVAFAGGRVVVRAVWWTGDPGAVFL